MKTFLRTTGLAMLVAAACVACDKIKPPTPELQAPPPTSAPADQQSTERQAFAQAAQKDLDDLRAVLAELKAKAASANLQTKARLAEEIEKLEGELRETQQRLQELRSATAETWSQLKTSFGTSLETLKGGIDTIRKRL